MNFTTSEINALKKLNQYADELDAGCQSGEVEDEITGKAQSHVNRTHSLLGDKANDQKAFIIYEVQSIIHWINGEQEDAYKLINSARDIKGDIKLKTETGRGILALASPEEKKILGLIAVVIGVIAIPYLHILGIVSILLGIVALNKKEIKSYAISGIILGIIALLIALMIFIALPRLQESQQKTFEHNKSLQNQQ